MHPLAHVLIILSIAIGGLQATPANASSPETGIASWYSMRNGAHGMETAHRPPLAKGTMLRVTAPNGRSVDVKIVDRGPYHKDKRHHYDRVVDLSLQAFEALGYPRGAGLIHNVRVDVIR